MKESYLCSIDRGNGGLEIFRGNPHSFLGLSEILIPYLSQGSACACLRPVSTHFEF